jgi:hypothetical protein
MEKQRSKLQKDRGPSGFPRLLFFHPQFHVSRFASHIRRRAPILAGCIRTVVFCVRRVSLLCTFIFDRCVPNAAASF